MARSTDAIAQQLAEAWLEEHPQILARGQGLGERARRLVEEALDQHAFAAVLHACAPMVSQTGPGSVGTLQREAERLACQDRCAAGQEAKGLECLLFALPISGALEEFGAWVSTPGNAPELASKAGDYLARLLGMASDEVERLEALPFLLSPAVVAAWTPDTRRSLLLEMLGGAEPRRIHGIVEQHRLLLDAPTPDKLMLGEAMWVLAATVQTHWDTGHGERTQRLAALAAGTLDDAVLDEAEAEWTQSLEGMGLPDLAFLLPPTGLNDGLFQTLRAHLMSARLAHHTPASLRDILLENDRSDVDPVTALACFQAPDGMLVLKAHSTHGPLPTLRISPHWALIEGEHAWKEAVWESFDMPEDTPLDGDAPLLTAPAASPQDLEGDHPAWKRAHPAPPGVH